MLSFWRFDWEQFCVRRDTVVVVTGKIQSMYDVRCSLLICNSVMMNRNVLHFHLGSCCCCCCCCCCRRRYIHWWKRNSTTCNVCVCEWDTIQLLLSTLTNATVSLSWRLSLSCIADMYSNVHLLWSLWHCYRVRVFWFCFRFKAFAFACRSTYVRFFHRNWYICPVHFLTIL